MNTQNLHQLHIIRGFAALYVAIGHAKVVFWVGGKEYLQTHPRAEWGLMDYAAFSLDMAFSAAQEFVIVFFVLSGFFIAHSFQRNRWTAVRFWVNRVIRIFPPYLFSMLLGAVALWTLHAVAPELLNASSSHAMVARLGRAWQELSLQSTALALLFLPDGDYFAGNMSFWSLLPEWMFYLLAPLLFIKRLERAALALFSLGFAANLFGFHVPQQLPVVIGAPIGFVIEYGFYFLAGIACYRWISLPGNLEKLPSKTFLVIATLCLLAATIGLGVFDSRPWSGLVATALSLSAMLWLVRYPLPKAAWIQPGIFLGNISYTLYLLHLPVYYLLLGTLWQWTGRETYDARIYWAMVPVAVVVSHFAYLLIEKQTLRIISRLKKP